MEKINITHQVIIGASPNEADLAMTSIDYKGNLGSLNEYVLSQYGYGESDLPSAKQLQFAGFGAVTSTIGKSIILVVTIDGIRPTKSVLEDNLYKALVEFMGWFRGRKLWIPLMGTGTGGLTLEDSYEITVKTINRFLANFPTEFSLIISLPDTGKGKILRNRLAHQDDSGVIELFLQKLNATFYVAGAFWSGEDQVERFLKDGIWEKGHDDKSYSDVINNIKENDIIILKSAFSSGSDSVLRVKGLGVVTKASTDGASVKVDWRIKDISIDINTLGKYRKTIAKISFDDALTIFSYLEPAIWQKLLPLSSTPLSVGFSDKIAGLISDSEKGNDYLGIDKDVRAFARVISARSFEPPLAIALFGKWGSGKSFFMRKLKEQIEDFALREANNMYCNGVVQIHFNAWSYMDANLWASFVSRIFEGLHNYIKSENIGDEKLKNIKSILADELNVARTNLDILEEKKDVIEKQIISLKQKESDAEKAVTEKITQLRTNTTWDILQEVDRQFNVQEKIRSEFNANSTYVKTQEELKEIVPEKYWNNPEAAYQQARSTFTFLKEFFKRKNLKSNMIWLTGILLIIFLCPIILELIGLGIGKIDFSISQAGLSFLVTLGFVWRRAEVVYKNLQPVVASFWKIKANYEQLKEQALAKFEQEEKALRLEIEKGEEEVLLIAQHIQKVEIIATELEYKINNALASETLYTFIDERSKSDDYKKHLGIISIIRKDFEILNELFIGHNNDIVNQAKAEEFRDYFKKPIQRIILYIDDLDRCPEENVVQVLEAVNLLMAFPLFVVIVGVDPRWVKNALIKKYTLQFAGLLKDGDTSKTGIEQIEPSSYLEKIFQIPFHLKDAKHQNVKDMIRQLAISKPEYIAQNIASSVPNDLLQGNNSQENSDTEPIENAPTSFNDSISIKDEFELTIIEKIEFLELSEKEVEALEYMSEILGPNPRAIKRFVNVFKIVKAHEDYTLNETDSTQELFAVLFLLALSTGQFRCLMSSFEEHFLAPENKNHILKDYLQDNSQSKYLKEKQSLNLILSDDIRYNVLHSLQALIFNRHNDFIKRFTFKNL